MSSWKRTTLNLASSPWSLEVGWFTELVKSFGKFSSQINFLCIFLRPPWIRGKKSYQVWNFLGKNFVRPSFCELLFLVLFNLILKQSDSKHVSFLWKYPINFPFSVVLYRLWFKNSLKLLSRRWLEKLSTTRVWYVFGKAHVDYYVEQCVSCESESFQWMNHLFICFWLSLEAIWIIMHVGFQEHVDPLPIGFKPCSFNKSHFVTYNFVFGVGMEVRNFFPPFGSKK